jgi:hypothetical protein
MYKSFAKCSQLAKEAGLEEKAEAFGVIAQGIYK